MSRYSYTVYLPDKRLPLPYLFSVSEQTRAQELESQIHVHPNFQPCLGQDIIYLFKYGEAPNRDVRLESVLKWLGTQSVERDAIEPIVELAEHLPRQPNTGNGSIIEIVIATQSIFDGCTESYSGHQRAPSLPKDLTQRQQSVEAPVFSVGPEQTTSASLPEIDEEFGGSASRKRPRLSGSPTRIADPSWPRLLHSMEEDILMHRNTFAIHAFLWKNKDHWNQIIDTVEVDIPDLASSVTVSDDPTSSTSVKARFIKLDHVPGLNYNIKSWPSMPRFLIREEYVELEHFVESGKRLGLVDTLLLGQPGIGKSMYLTYCLLRRLAAGKSTILSLSPKARYVFLDQGVYWIPDDSVLSLQQNLNRDSDGLTLYDINNEQDRAMDTSKFLTRWDSILASSPSEHRFKAWAKFNIQTSRKFVMKTWGWSEVYLSRDASKIQRGLDEWRRAFTNFGGSVRRLFSEADDDIERDIDMRVKLIDNIQLGLFLSETPVFFDTASHALVQINPQVFQGAINRKVADGTLISGFISHKLVLKRKKDLAAAFRDSFLSLLKNPGTASCAGILFKQMAQQYIFNHQANPYHFTSLVDSTQRLLVDLSHIDSVEYFDKFVSPNFLSSKYYCPISSTFPGIDSFAFEVNDQGGIKGMVAFQFTVSSSHPIEVKFFKEIWPLVSQYFDFVKFVFVVPKETVIAFQQIKLAADCGVWTPRIQQYVLAIDADADKFWE
ncbi:hypothetical protein QCA50_016523 [Cerrena zonata]|uniref:Uncharacterized protein n=1 Tax=Cerrena zonata TaxID=2478898 RepID=A0AAW0FRY1_9APHY